MDDDQLRDAFRGADGDPDDAFADALEARLRAAAAHGTVAVEMADAAELGAARRRRARGWRTVVAIGAAAALVGAVVVVRGGNHTGKVTLGDISNATTGTAHVETTVHSSAVGAGSTDSGGIDETMTGDVDFTHHASRTVTHVQIPAFSIRDDLTNTPITGPSQRRSIDSTSLFVNGHTYLSVGTVLGFESLPTSLLAKRWVRLDLPKNGGKSCSGSSSATTSTPSSAPASTSATSDAAAGTSTSETCISGPTGGILAALAGLAGGSVGRTGSDPSAVLDTLRKLGATLEPLGAGTVRGTAVQRYRVTLPHKQAAMAPISIEVDVDTQNRLRRSIVSYDLAAMFAATNKNVPKDSRFTQPSGAVRLQTDLFDFGTPVDIHEPPANDVMTMAEYEQAMNDSTPREPVMPQMPTKLTTPWHAIASSMTNPSWTIFQGTAKDWTCFAVEGTAVDRASFNGNVMDGLPANVDGKQATCEPGAVTTQLVAHLTNGGEVLVGVADDGATVTVQPVKGAAITVPIANGVFVWTAPKGVAAKSLTVTDKGVPVTCESMVSRLHVTTSGSLPQQATDAWSCDGAQGGMNGGSFYINGTVTATTAPATKP